MKLHLACSVLKNTAFSPGNYVNDFFVDQVTHTI